MVAEHDFRVGADIDEQRDFARQVGSLGEDHARGIGADMPGDARQNVNARVGMHGQFDREAGSVSD